ncbi:MAG: hypothetical protein ACKVOH_03055, partial [Chlamydiales bacterium]
MTIIVPVADLRREPQALSSHDFSHDDLRNSQLLYGEGVEILAEQNGWLHIIAKEQPCGEERYTGWIHKSEVILNQYRPNLVVYTPTIEIGDLTLSYGTYLEGDLRGHITLPDGRKANCDPSKLR